MTAPAYDPDIGFWLFSAAAALRSRAVALIRGPRERRVVWDILRERAGPEPATPPR